ncbi:MAG: hypothetical protein LBT00_04395 [Spirochaetaceae bacterium]|nr:hypothetical protein [Spirochaetaceae bacterium]
MRRRGNIVAVSNLPLVKQSSRGGHSPWIASLGNVPPARNDVTRSQ